MLSRSFAAMSIAGLWGCRYVRQASSFTFSHVLLSRTTMHENNANVRVAFDNVNRIESSLSMMPPIEDSLVSLSNSVDLSLVTEETVPQTLKVASAVLLFGGGLIPATISANKSLVSTLKGKKGSDSASDNPATSLDPTAGQKVAYIEDSGAGGPKLPNSAAIFASEKIPLVDVLAIVGRIDGVDSIADWKNLPSTKVEGLSNPDNAPMWLPRATFKANIRKAKFRSWPNDPSTGLPVGGEDLKRSEQSRVSKQGALIGDSALDAVYDTWAWGASVATPDKVDNQLNDWRNGDSLDVGKFVFAAVRGRAVTTLAAITFVIIQIVAYFSLFIAPALRVFFDVDIGFGVAGTCGPEGCTNIMDLLN